MANKNRKISVKEIKKERKKIEKELSELVEEPENVEEIAKVAAAVPLPQGNALKESEIAKEEEGGEAEEDEFFLTATSPRRRASFDDESEAASRMSGQEGEDEEGEEKERKEKEKLEDKYKLPSEEEQQEEMPSLDSHRVISEMMQKGMFMDSEQIKMMGRRGERTRFNEMLEAPETRAGALPEAPIERVARAGMQARTYESAKEKERAKSEGKAFGKGKEGKYKSYKE